MEKKKVKIKTRKEQVVEEDNIYPHFYEFLPAKANDLNEDINIELYLHDEKLISFKAITKEAVYEGKYTYDQLMKHESFKNDVDRLYDIILLVHEKLELYEVKIEADDASLKMYFEIVYEWDEKQTKYFPMFKLNKIS